MRAYVVLLLAPVWAQGGRGVVFFTGSWAQLLNEAQRLKRPIFVDVYAEWCGPCKMLERYTFPNPELGAYVSKHYVAYRLDAEKGEGRKLSNQYRVRAYPTLLFLDPTGKELGRQVGFVDAPTLLGLLQTNYAAYDKSRTQTPTTWEGFQEAYAIYLPSLTDEAWGEAFSATYQTWQQHVAHKDYENAQKLSASFASPARETFEALLRYHRGEAESALRGLHYELFNKGRLSPAQLIWICAYQIMYLSDLPPEALQWSTHAVRKKPSGAGLLTQAAVAYRLSRFSEAQTSLKEAQKEIAPTDQALAILQQLVKEALRQK